ncbi:hypothetical protein [Arenibaculum pallidiluteum]|uniref:hypothetical protein n=1 Tax=Arenibaculum pallidiluteum TaxID=2812559 RepID=UPI001A9606DC|nr:hypothetical protein [Arenibaculum pallidiluteum]
MVAEVIVAEVMDALAWIEAAGPVAALRRSQYVYALVSAVHILGLGLLVGSIAVVDLRVAGILRPALWREGIAELVPLARAGFGLAAVTGIVLFSTQATEYARNPAFLTKLGLIALALANVAAFHAALRRHPAAGRPDARLRAGAWGSLTLWTGTVLAGRLIGFL